MSEETQSVLYIGYAILFFMALMLMLGTFLPGLTSIETDIEATQQTEYRKAIVLENLLSLDADTESMYGYEYTQRRGVIPVEYFTNYNPGPNEVGYEVQGIRATQGHCYIPEVEGLDGTNFAFGVKVLGNEHQDPQGNSLGTPNVDYKSVMINGTGGSVSRACMGMHPAARQRAVVSTALLVRKDKNHTKQPVRLYVYDPFPSS